MTNSLSGSGSNANAAETKQILLKEIRAKWGKFSEEDLSSLKDKDDLVTQRAAKYGLEKSLAKRDVDVGHNVWVGYGACILRGVTVGNNAVIGTSAVLTTDVPDNAVVAGIPARVIRMRDAPKSFRWG